MSTAEKALSRKVNLQYTAIQSSFWFAFLPLGGFSVILLQSKNFTDSEIGIILAMQSIASILAQPVISAFAGKYPHIPLKKIVAGMLFFGAAITSIFFFLPHLFFPAVLIFIVIGMTQFSAPAFINAMAMQLSNAGINVNYGAARGIGSVSFALFGIILGKLVDISGTSIIIPSAVIFLLITCALLLKIYSPPAAAIPDVVDTASPVEMPKTSILTFLRNNKAYTGFCIASAFIFSCHTCITNFLPNITDSLGGSITDQGMVRGISAALELPIMFLYSRLAKRIGNNKLLTLSAFSFFLKSLATMLVPSMALFFAVQVFQMPAFGLYTPAAVHFSDHAVSDADRVRAQAISMVAGIGIGNAFGNLGAGLIIDKWGLHNMLLVSTVLGFIGFLIMFFALRRKPTKSVV